jgi:hypothetical protein
MMKVRFEFGDEVAGDIPRDTMMEAAGAGYPEVDLPIGTTIQAGEEAWCAFITAASDIACVLAHAAVLVRRNTGLTDWTLGA